MILEKIWGTTSERFLKKHTKEVKAIERLDAEMKKLTNNDLQQKTQEFKKRLAAGETLDDLMVESFAVCREACWRILGMKPFPTQLMGGIILHKGEIAEMKTGEGKTLVATLPTYLNGLSGKGVHVVTVNDYLTERDYELNKPLYDFLGLSSGYIIQQTTDSHKREAYSKDVTYIVNSQLGFDYLNDNRAVNEANVLQRELNYAIIDEVDSILLDEARTPLIISQLENNQSSSTLIANVLVSHLKSEEFEVNLGDTSVFLTEKGVDRIEKFFNIANLMDIEHAELFYTINQSLLAHFYYRKDKHYLVNNGKIDLIDENTGRVTKGRRFTGGLHQALEAKEGVEINKENVTLASITYQYFFRYYAKISGMTGTALTESEELMDVYNLEVISVPTNKPVKRVDYPDLVYSTQELKMTGILNDVRKTHKKGQPILIGVSTIEQSENLHEFLEKEHISHTVLNAKNHLKEADIISKAGQLGAVTIATNMAGRGTDIKLGEGVIEVGGLKIIGTERNMNRRVDNQLRGRSGRQGDIGESQFHVSLEDELLKVFATDSMKNIIDVMGIASGNEEGVVQNSYLSGFIEKAQGLLEGKHYDTRKQTIQYDAVTNDQRTIVYKERKQLLVDEVAIEPLIKGFYEKIIDDELSCYSSTKLLSEEELVSLIYKIEEHFVPEFTYDLETFKRYETAPGPHVKKMTGQEEIYLLKEGITEHLQHQFSLLEKATEETLARIKRQLLAIIDKYWRIHLEEIEEIRKGVHLVSYSGQNPYEVYFMLTEAKFKQMNNAIQRDMVSAFCKLTIGERLEIDVHHLVEV